MTSKDDMYELKDIIEAKRNNYDAYAFFCDNILAQVVGKTRWKTTSDTDMIHTFVKVSDEAFALLLLENSWDCWHAVATNRKTEDTHTLYTVNGAGTKKNQGWNRVGLRRFVELVDEVKEDRAADHSKYDEDSFEVRFLEEKRNSPSSKRGKKRRLHDYHNDDRMHFEEV